MNIEPPRAFVTFQQAINEWLADRGRECRPSTMCDYENTANTRLRPFFGDSTPIEEISTERVNELRSTMLSAGLAGRTVNKTLALAHGVFKLAMELHRLPTNPVATARRAKERRRKLERYLTAAEVVQLAAHAERPQDAALYELAAWTGLRWGELRALRFGDVDFAGSYVYVNRNWPCHGVEDAPKSGNPRAVPLWDQAARVLDTLSRREHFTADEDFFWRDRRAGRTRRLWLAPVRRACQPRWSAVEPPWTLLDEAAMTIAGPAARPSLRRRGAGRRAQPVVGQRVRDGRSRA